MPSALIVDDEEDMRFLIRCTIETANNGLTVAGEAADGEAALRSWADASPEIVVLDQRMPGMSGLEVARRMLQQRPDQPIILFSAYLDDETLDAARTLGIRACMPKSAWADLPRAIWQHAVPA